MFATAAAHLLGAPAQLLHRLPGNGAQVAAVDGQEAAGGKGEGGAGGQRKGLGSTLSENMTKLSTGVTDYPAAYIASKVLLECF